MCGFAGFYGGELENRREIVSRMGAAIAHRGPDDDGVFVDDTAALGFRRLSIIDLGGGVQPMASADGRYVMVFNGEIYNYRELRADLEKEGAVFVTDSDTEVILQTFLRHGKATAERLRGMFAFVIYDTVEKTLYGARDWFGIKPFYYTMLDGAFLFGSEIKSFLEYPSFRKEINRDALKLYLTFQYSPLEETIFKGVFRLLPGTYFVFDGKSFTTERYFEITYDPERRSFGEAVKQIDEAVLSSVEYHQIADVEVGSFLSGGVDSSYVASTVKPMKTYSVGFEVGGFDETALARDLSQTLGMPNRAKEISADEFFDALPAVQYHSDEPHANLSAVPLYYLAALAAEDVKVVLSGEGADELFGGYDWYMQSDAAKAYHALPKGCRRFFFATLGKLPIASLKRFLAAGLEEVEQSYIGQAFIMNDEEANALLTEPYRSEISYRDVTAPYYEKVKGCDDLTKKLYLDMHLWLPNDILLKADKMTMAHSLELRVPYLDREVFRVARTLTSGQKMKGRHTKRAFRTAALSHIPTEWANRKKAGFMVPFRVWLREDRYYEKVKAMLMREFAAEFFDTKALLAMLDEHKNGTKNNARKLYTVYAFLLWYEQYFILR
ncbi:MAG: asparagine synthase (glutamine-hydrolyzing) [Ruminococcaceae bacterium]|nr:asparagine synthase (glutamine-hydrolyzing) [Oscillospiraceae bacterium]